MSTISFKIVLMLAVAAFQSTQGCPDIKDSKGTFAAYYDEDDRSVTGTPSDGWKLYWIQQTPIGPIGDAINAVFSSKCLGSDWDSTDALEGCVKYEDFVSDYNAINPEKDLQMNVQLNEPHGMEYFHLSEDGQYQPYSKDFIYEFGTLVSTLQGEGGLKFRTCTGDGSWNETNRRPVQNFNYEHKEFENVPDCKIGTMLEFDELISVRGPGGANVFSMGEAGSPEFTIPSAAVMTYSKFEDGKQNIYWTRCLNETLSPPPTLIG